MNVIFVQDLKEDIDSHREPFKQLKVLAYKITDVCLQDDVSYIDAIVNELETRWKELLGLSSGRKKDLDENYKLSQRFFKGAEDLLKILDESEMSLKDEEAIGVDPAHLRAQLKKHKVCLPTFYFLFFFYLAVNMFCEMIVAAIPAPVGARTRDPSRTQSFLLAKIVYEFTH